MAPKLAALAAKSRMPMTEILRLSNFLQDETSSKTDGKISMDPGLYVFKYRECPRLSVAILAQASGESLWAYSPPQNMLA